MKQEVKQGQTDYTVLILIRDTAGAPKTGLVFNSAGIDVCYTRVETDNDVVLTAGAPVDLATPALTDPHLDWGFLQVDATNAPGVYRLDLPDGVFASGAWSAIVSLICTGCDPTHIEFMLVPASPNDGVSVSAFTAGAITGTALNATACTKIIDDFETQSAADPTGFKVNVMEVNGTGQTANDNGADINAILTDTNELQTDNIPGTLTTIAGYIDTEITAIKAVTDVETGVKAAVNALNNLSAANVNAEVVDALNVDTYGQRGQALIPATTSLVGKIGDLHKFLRNLITDDGTNIKVFNDAGAVVDHKAPVSEAAGTVTRGKFISGP